MDTSAIGLNLKKELADFKEELRTLGFNLMTPSDYGISGHYRTNKLDHTKNLHLKLQDDDDNIVCEYKLKVLDGK